MNDMTKLVKIGHTTFDTDLFLKNLKISIPHIEIYEEINSTNEYVKTVNKNYQNNTLFLAEKQSKGKGLNNREFYSPQGGLYFSLLLQTKLPFEQIQYITIIAGIAVVEAIEQLSNPSITPAIKWLNDVYLNKKKIAGILAEGKIMKHTYEYVILGIGINVDNITIPAPLQTRVTSIAQETGQNLSKEKLLATILNKFFEYYTILLHKDYHFMDRYRRYNFLIGKTLYTPDKREVIAVKTINDKGHLIIERNGKLQTLQSGETTLHDYIF